MLFATGVRGTDDQILALQPATLRSNMTVVLEPVERCSYARSCGACLAWHVEGACQWCPAASVCYGPEVAASACASDVIGGVMGSGSDGGGGGECPAALAPNVVLSTVLGLTSVVVGFLVGCWYRRGDEGTTPVRPM